MVKWKVTPDTGVSGSDGTYSFPKNTGTSNIEYTIDVEDDNGCTATTSVTVLTGSTCLNSLECTIENIKFSVNVLTGTLNLSGTLYYDNFKNKIWPFSTSKYDLDDGRSITPNWKIYLEFPGSSTKFELSWLYNTIYNQLRISGNNTFTISDSTLGSHGLAVSFLTGTFKLTIKSYDEGGCEQATTYTQQQPDNICVTSKGSADSTGVGEWYYTNGGYSIESIKVNNSIYNPPSGIDVYTSDFCTPNKDYFYHYDNYSEVSTRFNESEDTHGYQCSGERISSISFMYKEVEIEFGQSEENKEQCKKLWQIDGEYFLV